MGPIVVLPQNHLVVSIAPSPTSTRAPSTLRTLDLRIVLGASDEGIPNRSARPPELRRPILARGRAKVATHRPAGHASSPAEREGGETGEPALEVRLDN